MFKRLERLDTFGGRLCRSGCTSARGCLRPPPAEFLAPSCIDVRLGSRWWHWDERCWHCWDAYGRCGRSSGLGMTSWNVVRNPPKETHPLDPFGPWPHSETFLFSLRRFTQIFLWQVQWIHIFSHFLLLLPGGHFIIGSRQPTPEVQLLLGAMDDLMLTSLAELVGQTPGHELLGLLQTVQGLATWSLWSIFERIPEKRRRFRHKRHV